MLARHSLVWLHPEGWQEAESAAADECIAAVRQWRQADWPLIARRPDADAGGEECCLGLALPPDRESAARRRIGLRVARSAVRRVENPLPVAQVINSAPGAWQSSLSRLADQAASAGLSLRVYGSLALQALTGQAYLTPASDIDLLFAPENLRQLDEGMRLLGAASERLPLDGELVFPDGQAVAWKEWANAAAASDAMRVLAKDNRGVRLAKMAELRAQLEAA
ncbi:malonate decarboxylase holo-[acyl-carrier-protein] synthase [Noviherbaspirillum aerium]|uniref:malonate decarboxylase holo-[acyl-carrier-protein] synthase n=1 Tax=Noviherbaspirillum aerium TaxID=2588497 RepID=UPI00124CF208|nr:malonate decarboxylase holo-[acyl-carrier-protein] synthase [Noviherbaspirillum aerium]